jgi:PAS domain S-box-containing protein
MNILIVDDKYENLYLLESLLKGNGHQVQSSANGAEALDKIRTNDFDLIVSDILMPVMDGFQLCRKIKADESLRHIPFIVYTATYTGPQDEEFALKIGADRFIQKPCEPDVFMDAIRDVMSAAKIPGNTSATNPIEEEEVLKLYSERLVRKLEQKMIELEQEVRARQEAEESLKVSNSRLQLALASSNIGLWDWNLKTGMAWFSPEWKGQIGYEDHEILNRYEEWERLIHPYDRTHVMKAVEDYLHARRTDFRVEYRMRHKDSSYRWVAASGRLIKQADGTPTQRFMGCHVDITEQHDIKVNMIANEERFRTLFDCAPDAFFLLDFSGTITDANRAAETLTAYDKNEMVGKSYGELKLFAPDDLQKITDGFYKNTQSHPTGPDQLALTRKGGERIFIEIRSFPMKIADRNVVLCIARDISEHKSLQEQLNQSRKMEALGQLAGGVAHDFNNILQGMMGYAQILLDDFTGNDEQRKEIEEIYKGTERAADLTRQLLAFGRRQVMQPNNLDLNTGIERFMKMLRRVMGENIDLEWQPGKPLDPIFADTGMIDQVLMNLCINARDAMPQGGTLTIQTHNVRIDSEFCSEHTWAKPGNFVLLSVTDTGCGIENEILGRIFEPFFTTKEEGKGTGLGLATVYGIVNQHNGMIEVLSEPGKGTTFLVYFPICELRVDPIDLSAEGPVTGGNETILLAEDDEMVRNLVKKILHMAGYTVLTANDGEEAVRLFERHKNDIALLVLDVVMPKLNGRDALERIRTIRPDVQVLFSSGYSEEAIHSDGVLHEGLRLIQKPYVPTSLLRAVRKALDRSA